MHRFTRMAFAAVFVLGTSTIISAQSSITSRAERKLGEKWSANQSANEPQRLFVVIEANLGKKAADIQQIVKLGLEHLKKERKYDFDGVNVQPVSSTLYNGMKALFRGEAYDPITSRSGVSVRLISGERSTWEVRTGSPFARAKSITIYFEKDDEGKIITLSPPITFLTSPVREVDQAFRFHSPGTYVLSLNSESIPNRFEVELVADGQGESSPSVLKADWPQENLYYFLVIDRFVGDRRVLFETLKNNRVVGNGLKEVQTVESATISLATFIDSIDTGISRWEDERHYHVRVKKPDDKFPKRSWLLFPLDSEAAKSQVSQIKGVCSQGASDRQQLLESIRSSAVLAKDTGKIQTGSPAIWYEIISESKDSTGFSRLFEVELGTDTVVSNDSYFGLTIFEFNEEVILTVGNSFVQQNEHPRWSEGLHKLVAAAKKSQ